ncbi:ParB/RepB/Spo0J family partition protein [Magnetovibrio blakemorei]|uniref:Chromosome partitioning protein ParB n=1 Tax=Magnetovibrio blakemorei TaxID=28181 RepID=A0A1E5Q3B4_9PROT|nr:ParB/RepB/Spo0J family partition protein [Magnetovibrio blakemorei]OEJ64123.1 chromosome partitioning protein ParB [Magnetovibrio blakemorei]
MADKKLGMGLSALLGQDKADFANLDDGEGAKTVPVTQLHPGKYQPRHTFGDEQLHDLSESIREKGVLQPLLVRPHPDRPGMFEIIAGERRWRAAQLAQVHQVPVIVRDFDDKETLEVALVENLQRQDLSSLEEAEGYHRLMHEFSHTQDQLAQALGKSRSHVANTLRLLTLPGDVKDLLASGALSAGHARCLVGVTGAAELAKEIVHKGLNVRQTEKLVKAGGHVGSSKPKATKAVKDSDTVALEHDMANMLGLKVEIKDNRGRGQIVIHYESLEQLDGVLARLTHGPSGAEL